MVKTLIALAISATIFSSANAANVTTESVDKTAKVVEHSSVISTAKQQLMTQLATLKNLSADFIQQIVDADGNDIQQGNGHFILAKPNLLSWQTLQPDESTITSDGETIWLFDPFIEQVTAYSLAKSIANTPILLLTSDDQTLWQQYDVKMEQGNYLVIAKDPDAQVKQLALTFSADQLDKFSILDATGQQSHFQLNNVESNQDVSADVFTFTVPEGVLVDDQR